MECFKEDFISNWGDIAKSRKPVIAVCSYTLSREADVQHKPLLWERGGGAVCQRWGGRAMSFSACRRGLDTLFGLTINLPPPPEISGDFT